MISNIVEMSMDPDFSPDFDSPEYWARWYGDDAKSLAAAPPFEWCHIIMIRDDAFHSDTRCAMSGLDWVRMKPGLH